MTLHDLIDLADQSSARARQALAEEAYWRQTIAEWRALTEEDYTPPSASICAVASATPGFAGFPVSSSNSAESAA